MQCDVDQAGHALLAATQRRRSGQIPASGGSCDYIGTTYVPRTWDAPHSACTLI